MSFTLPNLRDFAADAIIACGQLKNPDAKLVQWLKDQPDAITSYRIGNAKHFIRARFGGKAEGHFHLEIVDSQMMNSAPKQTDKKADFFKLISPLNNLKISVNFMMVFSVRIADLPNHGIIKPLLLDTKSGEISIKLNSGTLKLTGTPVHEISWTIYGEKIQIILELNKVTTISDTYFTESAKTLQNAFDVLILGRESNVINSPKN